MINSVAKKTVLYMYKNNVVNQKDIEIYEYGAKIFLQHWSVFWDHA